LVKKDGLQEIAMDLVRKLKFDHNVQYDEKDSIGKRYRRQDAIGTPFCVTVDHQTKEDGTVTIRERDTMKQWRVSIDELEAIVAEKVGMRQLFEKLV
jgi:glycyl-tRNA synthetase